MSVVPVGALHWLAWHVVPAGQPQSAQQVLVLSPASHVPLPQTAPDGGAAHTFAWQVRPVQHVADVAHGLPWLPQTAPPQSAALA